MVLRYGILKMKIAGNLLVFFKNLVNDLDNSNNRKEKAAFDSYKVLRCKDYIPSVLIECGFVQCRRER